MNAIEMATIADRTPLVTVAEELLRRGIRERTGLDAAVSAASDAAVLLDVAAGIGAEGFCIAGEFGEAVRITGNDERGLIYGVGKFLRDLRPDPGAFLPGPWRGLSVPEKPVRGMYFATHFHNWYHVAPIEDVVRYVEDLALWGCNTISVWFDLSIYSGIDDPAAQAMISRLRTILAAAQRVGIRPALTTLANEGFATTPDHLKATNKVQNGYTAEPVGYYGTEVCPSVPGGMELILASRAEVLGAFRDIALEYIWLWPYDQGGCTCKACLPWGANGFLACAEAVARLVREQFPSAKIVLSTWYFDRFVAGEWQGLAAAFDAKRPDWVDYLLIDHYGDWPAYPLQHGVPGGFPAVSFPEISMVGMFPWGGYGANPRPAHWQAHQRQTRHLLSGGFPYSEGIYEDLNKVLLLQLGWAPEREAADIVREYAAAHLHPDQADDFLAAVVIMEELLGIGFEETDEGLLFTHSQPPAKAEACCELISRIDAELAAAVRSSWRWRILWLRAALDAELKRTGGRPSAHAADCFRELTEIYHAHNAVGACRPPQLDAGMDNRVDASVQAG